MPSNIRAKQNVFLRQVKHIPPLEICRNLEKMKLSELRRQKLGRYIRSPVRSILTNYRLKKREPLIALGSHHGGLINFCTCCTPQWVGTDLNTLVWCRGGPKLLSCLLRHAERDVGKVITPYPQGAGGEGGGGVRGGESVLHKASEVFDETQTFRGMLLLQGEQEQGFFCKRIILNLSVDLRQAEELLCLKNSHVVLGCRELHEWWMIEWCMNCMLSKMLDRKCAQNIWDPLLSHAWNCLAFPRKAGSCSVLPSKLCRIGYLF